MGHVLDHAEMTEQEAMREALEKYDDGSTCPDPCVRSLEAGWRAALRWAADGQEPVAWMSPLRETLQFVRKDTVFGSNTIPLYAAPVPNAQEEVERLRKALEQVTDGASGAHPSEFALCLARVDGIARAALAKGE